MSVAGLSIRVHPSPWPFCWRCWRGGNALHLWIGGELWRAFDVKPWPLKPLLWLWIMLRVMFGGTP